MFAVERLGSWVYTVAGPFHPFGGAVDIIVVEQPDGSFKSSPWYVRFGKFQGVLKTREKVVSINVNGVDANFHMHLDGRGAAYFLREVEGSEGESLSSPLSSSHERASPRSTMKSKSFNYDGSTPNLSVQNDSSNGKVVPRTNSQLIEGSNGKVMAQTNQRSRIMGLVFGRRSIMEGSHREGDDDAARRSKLDRAQIAADLLEVQWSTSLATSALGKPNASQLTYSGKLDVEGDKAVGANTESSQVNSSLHDTSETCVDHPYTFTQESSSSNVALGNCSQSGTDSSELSVPEACVDVPGFDTSGQVIETSSIDGIFFEDKDGLTSAFSIVIEEAALMNNYFDGKAEGVIHEIPTHDSQIPDVLKASSVENHDEHSTSDEGDAPSFGVEGDKSGFEKVQSVINVETSEASIVEVKDSSEQALEAVYLDCGGHREVCPPTEKLHATDELLPQETSVDCDCTLIVESSFSNTDVGNDSPSGIVSGEFPVREACVYMPGFDTLEKVVEISRIDEIVLGDKDGWTSEISTDVAEPTLTIPNFDGKGEGFVHEITTHDSPIPDMLNACSVENHDENSTSDEREAPSFGIQGEENGFGKVQSIRYVETAETSIMDVNDSSKQAQEAGYLVGGGHSEACPPTEKLHATDELLPQDLVTRPPKGMDLETKYIEAFDNYCQQIDSSACMNDHDEVNLDLSVTVSKSSTQVVSVDSAEVVDSKSISTSSSTCNSSHQIQIEKSADEIITKELGASFDSSCDSEQGVHGSGETSSVPSSESSEEDQFLFSDLDEGKLNEIQDKSNFPAPEGIQEVNGSFDANDESCSSPKMLVEEKNQLPDFVNLMGNSKMMSSSIGVPIAHNAAGVGWLAQSLPSTWAHPDRLDTGGFRHTLSHSVDSNCSLEWSLDCKEALLHGSLESENQLVQDLSDDEDTQNSNLKSDATNPAAGDPSKAQTTSGGSWGLWPFSFRRSISSEAMQPPSNDTTVQPPSIDTTVQSPSNDTAVQPPSNDTTVQPPLIDMRPPSHDNTVQPPLNDTTVQPPLNDTTVQSPLNDTTMQPPLTGIVVQPPFNDTTIQQIQNDTTMLPTDTAMQPTLNNARNSDAENVSEGKIDMNGNKNVLERKVRKNFVRALSPTSEQLASLNLKEGRNVVTFTFSTAMLGKQQVDARIYLWKWNTRIVISDVDGTITKSDVLGQFMPLVGVDWSQTGVTHLFSAIKENGYQLLFLSARAISQAHLTRQFLFNLKQDGKTLPDGPVVISPDGLFPSLFREVIRRAPHEFKIACLEDIKALFPVDCNPFYAGFGNRDTDEISYMKVGIPKGKIFTINAKGQVAVNRRVDTRSYTSLHTLVHGMFPSTASFEQEDFNSWNFWRLPPADI